jgi:hypothetical protein
MELPKDLPPLELGGILHLDDSTSTSFAANLGDATNNFNEFMVVKLLLTLAKKKEYLT